MYDCMVCGKPVKQAWKTTGTIFEGIHKACFNKPRERDKAWFDYLWQPKDWRDEMSRLPYVRWNLEDTTAWQQEWERSYDRIRQQLLRDKRRTSTATDLGIDIDDAEQRRGIDYTDVLRAVFEMHPTWGYGKFRGYVEQRYGIKLSRSYIQRRLAIFKEDAEDLKRRDEQEDFTWWADERIAYLKGILDKATHPRTRRQIEARIDLLKQQRERDIEHYRRQKRIDVQLEESLRGQKALQDAALQIKAMKERQRHGKYQNPTRQKAYHTAQRRNQAAA